MKYDVLILEPFREMTLMVADFIPTLLIALGILFIGCIIAHAVQKLVVRMFMPFDEAAESMGITQALKKGGVRQKPSAVLGCLTYWVMMVMVLIMSVKALGVAAVSGVLDRLLAYIPNVITGVVVLIFGMLLAKFVATIIYIAAKNTDMPIPLTLAKLSKLAIVIYVSIIYLTEIGFVGLFSGANYSIFLTGIVFALALAFGLAGKDVAAKYLGVLDKTAK